MIQLPQLLGLNKFTGLRPDPDLQTAVSEMLAFKVPAHTDSELETADVARIKKHLHERSAEAVAAEMVDLETLESAIPAEALINLGPVQAYLTENLPKNEYELTPLGLRRVVAPSKSEDFAFLWKCRIMDNPYYIMQLFAKRTLVGSDVECLKAVYSDIHQQIVDEVVAQMLEKYRADAAVPRKLGIMLAILFQAPTIKLEQLAAYKAGGESLNVKDAIDKGVAAAPKLSQQESE